MPRAEDRFDARPRAGLARRAHAHRRRRVARWRKDLRLRRIPERLRQDELRDADPAEAVSGRGLEGHDRRRRYRLDQARRRRQALRDQPRERLLRRRARARTTRPIPTRWSRSRRTRSSRTSPSPTTATSGGKAWTASRPHTPSTGKATTGRPRQRDEGRAPECTIHRADASSAR